jgi:23S rRNA (adenine2503-C2)-methyltransferase
MSPSEICVRYGLAPAYRGLQVFRWIQRGARTWEAMTDLPAAERERLSAQGPALVVSIAEDLSDPDGTRKLAVRLSDGLVVECVLLVDSEGRRTACLSTQAGCPMGCAFCRTGQLGFKRNLSASEMVEQLLLLNPGAQPCNVVFMGMGEPLLNLEELRAAIAVLRNPEGLNISLRKITVSTSGLVAGILDLAGAGPYARLAVSLTSARPEIRAPLMPVEKSNCLPDLKRALQAYQAASGDRITLEAAIMGGLNTGPLEGRAIADFCAGLKVQVNLIPWNPVEGADFREPTRQEMEELEKILTDRGIAVTRRMRRGRGVSGACGQLGDLSGARDYAVSADDPE